MSKRKLFGTIIGLILFAITVVSFTYAYYSWRSGETGVTFNINDSYFFCETDLDSSVSSLAPTNNYRNGTYQVFNVNNIGRSDTTFSLSMNITSISEVLKDPSFKYRLMLDPTGGSRDCSQNGDSCTLVGEGNFSQVSVGMNTLIGSINLPNNSRYRYYFFMYLDGTMSNPSGIQEGSMVSSLGVCDIYAFFDANGDGTSVSPTFKKVTVDQAYGTLPVPTRDNAVVSYNTNGGSSVSNQTVQFKFGGWYQEENYNQLTAVTVDSTKATTAASIVEKTINHTMKARWQDNNGKFGETSNLCITLPNAPTKAGYTFNGWYLDTGLNNKVGDAGEKYCPSKSTVLYAKWDANEVVVTINKDGSAWTSSNPGINVALYQNGTSKYAYSDGTKSGNKEKVTWSGVTAGTYDVYISKDAGHMSTLVDSGVNVTISSSLANNHKDVTVNMYTLTIKLTNATATVNGTNINNNGTVVVAGGTTTATNNYAHALVGGIASGYHFSSWTVTSGTVTLGSSSNASTTAKVASAATITATGAANTVKINLAKDGEGYSGSGMKVTLYNGTNDTTHTATVTSGSVATLSGAVPNGTYNVYIGKDSNHKTTLIDSGVDVTVNNDNPIKTVNYYTLTIKLSNATTTVNASNVANNGTVVVAGGTTTAANNYGHALVGAGASGYHFGSWTVTSGTVTLGSTSDATTTAKVASAATITATGAGNTVKINLAKDGEGYSNSGMKVTLYSGTNATTHTATVTSGSVATLSGAVPNGTYNVYIGKDSNHKTDMVDSGVDVTVNNNDPIQTVNYYTLTIKLVNATAKVNASNTADSDTVIVAGGTATASNNYGHALVGGGASGYHFGSWTVTSGTVTLGSTSDATTTAKVSSAATITATGAGNTVKVNIAKDGSGYSNSGMKVTLYNGTTATTHTATVSSGSVATLSGAVPNGTYNVYIGKDSNHKTTLIDSGVDVTVNNNNPAAVTVNYYTLTIKLSNATTTVNGTSVADSATVIVAGGTTTAANNYGHALVGGGASGYHFSSWTVTSGTVTLGSTSAANTTAKVASAATITATGAANTVKINLAKDGEGYSGSGMKVTLYSGTNATTHTATVTSGSVATLSGAVPNGTYNVYIGKDSNHKTDLVDSGVDVTVNNNDPAAVTVNYYLLTINLSNAKIWINDSQVASNLSLIVAGGTATAENNYAHALIGEGASGYHFSSWTVTSGNVVLGSTSSATTTAKIASAATITATGEANTVKINLVKDGESYSNSGMKVTLYNGTNATTHTATVSSGSVATLSGAVPNGTYNVYIGKDSNHKTDMVDSGVDVTVNNNNPAAVTVNYYTLTMKLVNATTTVNGTSVADSTTVIVAGGTTTAANNYGHALVGGGASGYHFSSWAVTSGTVTLGSTSAANTTAKVASAATITATGVGNTVKVNIAKDGSGYSGSGMKVTLYNGTTATTYTATVSSGSVATLNNVPNGTYNVYIGQDSNHKTTMVDSNVDVTVNNNNPAAVTVNYYTLTIKLSNATTTVNASNVANNGTVIVAGGTTTAANNYGHALVGGGASGYHFSSWTVTSGTVTLGSTSDANTTAKVASAATITATGEDNTVKVNIAKDGTGYSDSGMKVTLYNGTTATTYTSTVSSGSVATLNNVPNGTYNVYISKDSIHETDMVDSGVDVTVNNNNPAAVTVNYYTLTIKLSNATTTVNATNVANNGTVIVAGGTTTAANNYGHALVGGGASGYHFSSWAVTSGTVTLGSTSDANTTAKVASAATITATGAPNSYVLTYDCATNGGTANSTQNYNYGASVDLTKTCTKSGWTHVGWAESSTATTKLNSYTMPAGAKTLYAIYKKDVTITFNKNGASTQTNASGAAVGDATVTRTCTIWNANTSCNVTSPTIVAVSGFSVLGYGQAAGSNASAWNQNTARGVSDNATWYAQTRSSSQFTLSTKPGPSGPTGTAKTASCYRYNAASSCNVTTPTNPYTWSGWSWVAWTITTATTTTATTGTGANVSVTLTGNTNAVAIWKNNTAFTLTTKPGPSGPTGTAKSVSCNRYNGGANCTVAAPTNPYTWSGWTWVAWTITTATTTTATTGTGANATVTLTGNTNAVAIWKFNTAYTLTTKPGPSGPTGTASSVSCNRYNGSANCVVKAPTNPYTWSGWTWVAWAITTGTTTTATTGTAANANVTLTGNTNAVAIWKNNTAFTLTTKPGPSGPSGTAKSVSCNRYNGGTSCTVAAPTNPYTWSGWTWVAWAITTGTTTTATTGTAANANVTLTGNTNAVAIWKNNTAFTLTTKPGPSGPSGTAKSVSCNRYNGGTSCTVAAPTNPYTWSGWTWVAWAITTGTTTTATTGTAANANVTLTGNTNAVAIWKNNTAFTLTTKTGPTGPSGTAKSVSCNRYNGGTSCNVTTPTNPYTWTNWSWVAWTITTGTTTTATTGTAANTSISLTGNTNAVAIWKKTVSVTVTFDKNGGTANTTSAAVSTTIWNGAPSLSGSLTFTAPACTSWSGWSCLGYNAPATSTSSGWNVGATKSISVAGLAVGATATTASKASGYYHIWRNANYDTQYTATTKPGLSGPSGSAKTASCKIAAVYNGASIPTACTITLPANPYTWSPWTFNGWVNAGSGTATSATSGTGGGGTMSISGNVNIVAVWKKTVTVSVTFDKNGGSSNTSTTFTQDIYNGNQTLAAGTRSITAPAGTTRVGYKFLGYNTTTNATTSAWNAGAAKNLSIGNLTVAVGSNSVSKASGYYHVWKKGVWAVSSPAGAADTLSAAVTAANAGATLTLQQNSTETGNISISKKVTITAGSYTLTRNAGVITLTGTNQVTISGGTWTGTGTTINSGMFAMTTAGNLKITGGTFTNNSGGPIVAAGTNATTSNSQLAISGGTFTSKGAHGNTIRTQTKNAIAITGGKFTKSDGSANHCALYNLGSGTVTVTNACLKCNNSVVCSDASGHKVNMTSGTVIKGAAYNFGAGVTIGSGVTKKSSGNC